MQLFNIIGVGFGTVSAKNKKGTSASSQIEIAIVEPSDSATDDGFACPDNKKIVNLLHAYFLDLKYIHFFAIRFGDQGL